MADHKKDSIWRGVLIEEAFTDKEILAHMTILRTEMEQLEGETGSRTLHFDKVEIREEEVNAILDFGQQNIGKAWYFHLVNGNIMKVIFRGKVFEVKKNDIEKINEIRQYGLSQGILEEQMQFERLFDNPYDE